MMGARPTKADLWLLFVYEWHKALRTRRLSLWERKRLAQEADKLTEAARMAKRRA